jgi:L-asparaginase
MMLLANGEGRSGVEAARTALLEHATALDAVERGIRAVEANPSVHSVGLGGAPNLEGEVECDAAIMEGETLQAGAVGALKGCLHAISAARKVMEHLPHNFLVGDGAARFCQEVGIEEADMLTGEAAAKHKHWIEKHVPPALRATWPDVPLADFAWESARGHARRGTTIFLAIDEHGNIAGGTSTSGWARKYPGRLGDTPIVGAGLYVDNRYGACACTHTGEMTIRAATAHSVVQSLRSGGSVEDACRHAASDLAYLRGGCLGPVVIHAINNLGNPCVVATEAMPDDIVYYHWRFGASEFEVQKPSVVIE